MSDSFFGHQAFVSNLRNTPSPGEPAPEDAAPSQDMPGAELVPPANMRSSWLLVHASHAVRMKIESALKPCGLTGLQMSVLNMIKNRGGSSSAELSRRFFKTPQAMGQLLNPLLEQGLIQRAEDPDNRRVLRLTLTDAGRKAYATGDAAMRRLERDVFSRFDDETLDTLRASLYQISHLPSHSASAKRKDD
ncbi:MarR family winged helix-turn-helix transcriptional regulator [Hydrogenophaga laconesensis]|uniref:DNA-binding MarR family transcriptional regulator n=1 Tax=Hydrogenophaga laconesensis TaxID=1805971 RepID=A0ABU1VAT8_9BURK|nr:MarR family transcriptional regulator [Hydrogenophaga laconesensis]MDR7094593.1 DNA-binding MarR family transcriptional regulator [Hydrogenophaga laconesensis]